jgi:hypothetical protein
MRVIKFAATAALLGASLALVPVAGTAMPLSPGAGGAALVADSPVLPIIEVRNNGAAAAAGFLGGLIVSGIIASQPHYYGPYGYYYPPYAYYPPAGVAIASCARRFKSYDPYSMTYLGYDGLRHPCP